MQKIVFIALIFCYTGSKAQYIKPFFNTLSIENGLPEGYVAASIQDKLGYLWFGTQNGLIRYDGYQLKQYVIPDDKGIPLIYCSILHLHEDKNGKLWVLIDKEGLYCFNRQKDAFFKVKINQVDNNIFRNYYFNKWVEDKKHNTHWLLAVDFSKNFKPCLFAFDALHNKFERYETTGKGKYFIPSYEYSEIVHDATGKIWITADSLLSYFDPGTKSFIPWFVIPDSSKKIKFYGLMADPVNQDIIWSNTYISGIDEDKNPYTRKFLQLNTKTRAYKIFMHNDNDPASIAGNCTGIIADSLNRIWFNTQKGVSFFNQETRTFKNYNLKLPLSSTGEKTYIDVVSADNEGNLWIGGNFRGLFYLELKTGVAAMYSHTNDQGSLPDFSNGINKLFFDRSGTLWISMPWSGIACLDQRKSMFNPLAIIPSSVGPDEIKSLDECHIVGKHSDSIFYVINTKGFYAWNHKQNSYKRIELNNNKLYRQIKYVIAAKDGQVWIASRGSGLFCYNPVNKSVKNFRHDPKDSTSLSSDDINILKEDQEGNLWIGTINQGLCQLNRTNGIFTRYPFLVNIGKMVAKNALDDSKVHSIFCDKEGILWVGTNLGGLNRLDTKTGKFTSFLDMKAGFNCVINIYEDKLGRFWAGTYLSGLFLFDKKTGGKKRYSEKDGLLFNAVIGISEDNSGNIWLASVRGLSKFNPDNKTFTNFPTLPGDNLFNNILYKSTDGLFHMAIPNGLISFDPDNMNENAVPPAVLIESVSYIGKNNRDSVLFTYGRNQIDLAYNENKISFQFVALHYANSESNQYAFMLDGYDKDWIQAGTQRSATYTNLSPGRYIFRVKAANSDGIWNEKGASISVTILPPWWKTWWAYCIYGLMLLAGILAVHRFQKERTIRSEREKTQKKELLQAKEIEKAYTELKSTQSQLIQSEKMASLGELTAGIAHEIQNPLNFVNNFSEVSNELLDEMKAEMDRGDNEEAKAIASDIKLNLEKILHHGKRADAIVKGMLQHSRSSNGVKEPTDINALADEYLRLAYHGLRAKDKSFNATLNTDFDETIGEIDIIPQDIGRVILNLITNAFYVVDKKKKQQADAYEPTVSVSTRKLVNEVLISVKDNGNGIPQKLLDKIFQPFFTTKPTGEGTGLGLSLAYDIVKAHGGELNVETTEGEGTTFTIQIPA